MVIEENCLNLYSEISFRKYQKLTINSSRVKGGGSAGHVQNLCVGINQKNLSRRDDHNKL